LFWRHEKAISFGFGKLAFSERNNTDSFHWRNKKTFSFRFGIFVLQGAKSRNFLERCFVIMKRRFVYDSESSVFQRWQNGNRFMFFWRSDKAIRVRFGKFDFSGRQNARSPVNVVLVP
jgi:hypothetical protein